MKRPILSVILLSLALLSASFGGHASFPEKSIQPLQLISGPTLSNICTTFSINEQEGYWATAAHCVIDENASTPLAMMTVAIHGQPAEIVFVDQTADLAVVRDSVHAPAIARGYQPGEEDAVSIYGFLFGGPKATRFNGTIANLNLGGYMVLDCHVGPGHSGSPVLDRAYHVISVAQVNAFGFAGGAPYDALDAFTPFWGV